MKNRIAHLIPDESWSSTPVVYEEGEVDHVPDPVPLRHVGLPPDGYTCQHCKGWVRGRDSADHVDCYSDRYCPELARMDRLGLAESVTKLLIIVVGLVLVTLLCWLRGAP